MGRTSLMWRTAGMALGSVVLASSVCVGQHTVGASAHAAATRAAEQAGDVSTGDHADAARGPVLSHDPSWTVPMVGVVGLMFAAAAVVGPLVRSRMPAEVPPAHSHDEPPGTSGHHGRSGTANHPEPDEHGRAHGHH